MVCSRNSNDPLAHRFYEEEGFIILGRGFGLDDFQPGIFLRRPTETTGRNPVEENGSELFENWKDLKVESDTYTRFSRDVWSGKLSASTAAEISTSLTGQDESVATFKGQFQRANVSSLKISLEGARLWSVREADFERLSKELKPKKDLIDNLERAHRLYFVTHALSVTGARMELEDSVSTEGFLEAAQAGLAKLALKLGIDSERKNTLEIDNIGGREVMMAFRCLELFIDDEFNISGLGAPSEPLSYRNGAAERPLNAYTKRDAFDDGDDLMLRVGRR